MILRTMYKLISNVLHAFKMSVNLSIIYVLKYTLVFIEMHKYVLALMLLSAKFKKVGF